MVCHKDIWEGWPSSCFYLTAGDEGFDSAAVAEGDVERGHKDGDEEDSGYRAENQGYGGAYMHMAKGVLVGWP